jgi:opacity protein-like surface antigen
MKKSLMIIAAALFALQVAAADLGAADGVYLGVKAGAAVEHGKGEQTVGPGEGEFDDGTTNFDLSSTPFGIAPGIDTSGSFLVGAQIGYDFHNVHDIPLRIELDYTYRAPDELEMRRTATLPLTMDDGSNSAFAAPIALNTTHKSKITMQTVMANFLIDFRNYSNFTPYVGAGAGVALLRVKNRDTYSGEDNLGHPVNATVESSDREANFAWSVGAGVGYSVTENLTVDFGYRFLHAGKVTANYDLNIESAVPLVDFSAPVQSGVKDLFTHDVTLGLRYGFE